MGCREGGGDGRELFEPGRDGEGAAGDMGGEGKGGGMELAV